MMKVKDSCGDGDAVCQKNDRHGVKGQREEDVGFLGYELDNYWDRGDT